MQKFKSQSETKVSIQIDHKDWLNWLCANEWKEFIFKITTATFQEINWNQPSEISILLTNDSYIQKLNSSYRNKNTPTNVLSFPILTKEELQSYNHKKNNYPIILGDIVLSLETVIKEVEQENKLILNHITHLIVHGILHLFNYNHEECDEAEVMENLEKQTLNNLGLPNPYQ